VVAITLPLPHNSCGVAEGADFLELVRDEDDGAALIRKLAQRGKQ
jgi:hypothetical protein